MTPKIKEVLSDFGLTPHEAAAYVALLQMGKGSADAVASRANIKRSTAYLALESLLRQGFIGKVPRARKMLFVAKDPVELREREQQRMKDVDRLVPLLRSMAAEANHFGTRLYEGFEGLKAAYNFRRDELQDTEYVGFFGSAEKVDEQLADFVVEWNEENAKRNISSRAIVPGHPSLKAWRQLDAAHKREVKVISKEQYPSNISIEMYEDFVRITLFEEKAALIIESKALALALKSVFELVW
ncbi:MAG: helix-turn-helix domain-containing protein [Patescibacteria group bacterium]